MREEDATEAGGVMHCFTETREVAEAALDLGFFISFSGIVTFRNATDLKAVAQYVPLDRLLIETTPRISRRCRNAAGPTNPVGIHVAEEIARLRSEPLERIEAATTENFFRRSATQRKADVIRLIAALLAALAFSSAVLANSYEDSLSAARRGDTAQLVQLLNRGVDPNTVDDQGTRC